MRLQRTALAIWLVIALGCTAGPPIKSTSWLHPFAAPSGPDVIAMDVSVIERPLGDRYLNDELWSLADEQVIPLERKALEVLGPRMLRRDFEPGFYVEHFIKDMGIALAEAERMNLSLPGLGLAKQLYEAVRAQGYGRKGTQALLLALEHLNNVKR